MSSPLLVFNRYASAVAASTTVATTVGTDLPIIALKEIDQGSSEVEGVSLPRGRRHAAQLGQLAAWLSRATGSPALGSALFGPWLDWSYRAYGVHSRPAAAALGERPPQPSLGAPPSGDDDVGRWLAVVADGGVPPDKVLYLFNVIVAIEWLPTPEYLTQLEWAFRRASDYLYDATNGAMAFGQVVFADASCMAGADIQITASNRRLPRSWTSGLVQPRKYTPIRVGRGLWLRDRRIVIDWDEPEGWRALIHEWGHYALGYKDDYLRTAEIDRIDDGVITLRGQGGANGGAKLVIIDRAGASRSLMATPQGNSEFDYAENQPPLVGAAPGATTLSEFYPEYKPNAKKSAGPGGLPLPLPLFHRTGALGAAAYTPEVAQLDLRAVLDEQPGGPGLSIAVDDRGVPRDTWEVFVVRRDAAGGIAAIIPQGEIDARTIDDGFTVLGARAGDRLVVTGRVAGAPQTWVQAITGAKTQALAPARALAGTTGLSGEVLLRPGVTPYEVEPIVAGGGEPIGSADTTQGLDGAIYVSGPAGSTINDYSEGGGPGGSAPNLLLLPLAAGSASGDALLFFDKQDNANEPEAYRDTRVVTTTLRGAAVTFAGASAGYVAGGPVYSIASTRRMPPELHSTLVLLVRAADVAPGRDGRIFGVSERGEARPLPTYVAGDGTYIATPLDAASAPALTDEQWQSERIERFVLGVRR